MVSACAKARAGNSGDVNEVPDDMKNSGRNEMSPIGRLFVSIAMYRTTMRGHRKNPLSKKRPKPVFVRMSPRLLRLIFE